MPPNATQNEPQPSLSAPFFVNMYDSNYLDDSSRTQVRVQVMKNYHRQRSQKQGKFKGPKPSSPLNAKAQTLKFRLGAHEPLTPWAPVKSGHSLKAAGGLWKRKTPQQKALEAEQKLLTIAPVPLLVDINHTNDIPLTDNYDQESTNGHGHYLFDFDSSISSPNLYTPASNMVDPFNSTALPITSRTKILLHHYFKVQLASAWLMMPMRKTLYSVAITDPAMFHSFLAHYASTYNTSFKVKDSLESIYHATMASSLINERLSNSANGLSDSTVATVANLCAYESSNGSRSSMIIHINGLERMVRLRGGLHEGRFSLIVQRMIAWADFHVATALLQTPRFPPLNIGSEAEPFKKEANYETHSFSFGGRPKKEKAALMDLLSGVESLCSTLRLLKKRAVMPEEDIWYADKIYFLQRNLFDIAHGQHLEEGIHVRDRELDRLCALAALMYCAHCLRNTPLSYASFVNGVARLKPAIEYFKSNFAFEGYDLLGAFQKKKMLWVLVFGGCAADGKAERPWFVTEVQILSLVMGISDWDSMKGALESVLWQLELDDVGRTLWREVEGEFFE